MELLTINETMKRLYDNGYLLACVANNAARRN